MFLWHVYKHTSTLKIAFVFSFDLENLWRRQVILFSKNEARTQRIHSTFKWPSQAQNCIFSMLFSFITTHWPHCQCEFFVAPWATKFVFSPDRYEPVLCSLLGWKLCWPLPNRNCLDLEPETLAVPETLRDLLVVRKMSSCCFYLDQMNSRQSSKKHDFDFA